MKKLVLILAGLAVFAVLPLLPLPQQGPPAPPEPLDKDMIKWLVGDWEGTGAITQETIN